MTGKTLTSTQVLCAGPAAITVTVCRSFSWGHTSRGTGCEPHVPHSALTAHTPHTLQGVVEHTRSVQCAMFITRPPRVRPTVRPARGSWAPWLGQRRSARFLTVFKPPKFTTPPIDTHRNREPRKLYSAKFNFTPCLISKFLSKLPGYHSPTTKKGRRVAGEGDKGAKKEKKGWSRSPSKSPC